MDGMDRGAARLLPRVGVVVAAAVTLAAALAADGGGADAAGLRERPGAGRPGLQRLGRVDPAPALGRDGVRLGRRRQARPHARRRHPAGPDRHRGPEGAGGLRDEPVLRGHGRDRTRSSSGTSNHELGAPPPPRTSQPAIPFNPNRTSISTSEVNTWVPRGFAVVHSESPGTGLSQGCPTVGGTNENDGPKAVVDWLNGRAKGYTTIDGNAEVPAYWSTGKVGMTGTSYNGTLPISAATTGVAGPRGDHPDRAEHLLLPLLPLERAGAEPRRLGRRGHRLPLRLHQQRRPGAAAVLHRHGPRGPHEAPPGPGHRRLQRLLGRPRPAQPARERQGRDADGARVQRLERRPRAQRPDRRGAQGQGAGPAVLPPGRPRRRAAARPAQPLVHALPLRQSRTGSRTTRRPG